MLHRLSSLRQCGCEDRGKQRAGQMGESVKWCFKRGAPRLFWATSGPMEFPSLRLLLAPLHQDLVCNESFNQLMIFLQGKGASQKQKQKSSSKPKSKQKKQTLQAQRDLGGKQHCLDEKTPRKPRLRQRPPSSPPGRRFCKTLEKDSYFFDFC